MGIYCMQSLGNYERAKNTKREEKFISKDVLDILMKIYVEQKQEDEMATLINIDEIKGYAISFFGLDEKDAQISVNNTIAHLVSYEKDGEHIIFTVKDTDNIKKTYINIDAFEDYYKNFNANIKDSEEEINNPVFSKRS